MIAAADFDEAYNTKPCNMEPPVCQAPECFIGSYPPVSPPGVPGNFNVNTSFLQPLFPPGIEARRSWFFFCKFQLPPAESPC